MEDKLKELSKPLPEWALKSHPTKSNMTVIHPMAVVDRLNEVFGIGGWNTKVQYLSCDPFIQKTRNGDREMFRATAHVVLDIPTHSIHLEQFGGSSNDDAGDALKGSATDGLTKCASYLGVGASIYKGQGNGAVSARENNPSSRVCDICGAGARISPKSGKEYCPNWKDHKEQGEFGNIINKSDKEFIDSMPEYNSLEK